MDQGNRGNAVELISIGPIGTDHKLSGVRCWHRTPAFKHLEWNTVQINNNDRLIWIEISDTARLVKIINSFKDLSVEGDGSFNEDISVVIDDSEMRLKHQKSCTTFTLAVRSFDAEWAASLTIIPASAPPRCALKIISGLDQIAAILKRVERWREEWSVDVLTLSTVSSTENGRWDIQFEAETSTPPHLKLKTTLPSCPEAQSSTLSSTSCSVSVNLSAATRALISPLAESKIMSGLVTGASLFWIPEEALVCNVNWNAAGFGQVASTIYLPSRMNNKLN
jgi:hypothetical protein